MGAVLRGSVLALWIAATAGCDDPTMLRPAPGLNREMILTMVLDPDESRQVLFVEAVDVDGHFEGWVRSEIFDSRGSLIGSEIHDSIPKNPADRVENNLPCAVRYGVLGTANPSACFEFDLQPEHGSRYRVRVSAEGRPTAEAETLIPGDFQILDVDATGSPPGTTGLRVRWTPSSGSYRYIVAIRSERVECYDVKGCLDGWYADTDATELYATVPAEKLRAGRGPWWVDVYAMDRALYEYLTTGSGGDLFAIPPVQNVEGGYGVIGAWVRRSARVGT